MSALRKSTRTNFVAVLSISLALAISGCAGRGVSTPHLGHLQPQLTITAEQARAALLELKSLRVLLGDDTDPIYLDLKAGKISWSSDTSVMIGSFISCDLKEGTWQMLVRAPAIRFFATARGRFDRQPDGTWSAIQTGGSIS